MSSQNDKTTVWTPANVVTVVRIAGVPLFVAAFLAPWPAWLPGGHEIAWAQPWVAAALFAVLAATDGVDGYLARSRNEVTDFGKFVDPLADKILVAAALLALTELQILPSWVALVILVREFIVSGLRMIAAAQGAVVAASWYGKAKTCFQIAAILMFILKDAIMPDSQLLFLGSWLVMLIALALTIVSMVDYFMKCRGFLGLGPKPEPEPTLAEQVVAAAKDANVTLGTAESLTGGLISAELTSVPGSSAVVRGGVTSYAIDVKENLLGVSGDVLESQGAVDQDVVLQMAQGAAEKLRADLVVAVSGIAGPGGAEPDKPVGTVWMGWWFKGQSGAERLQLKGDRDKIRQQTAHAALKKMKDLL
ncbi:MAG: CDP-diacylglycerol--glycerol-3-phosphate 3-phosphatidyltransferase [Coriobacteriia bacterium]|nr:CDP-diacylglycerol--glycerol-3-phosphate 3-phosphatidyltransferase [Coriobacteriia bacterium]